ncbi:probable membrane-associated progesterone receptor component 2 [Coccomyxa sp. Obi]|nr:probable membrane-associated progesterone receptor component 2 [Coccomyxa sp. Obi]
MSKEFSLNELSQYDGIKREEIYISVRGKVYDMTPGKDFYGPGAGYHVFAGKECSRALAKMSLSAEDCTGQLDDLDEKQLKVLDDWQKRFDEKYTFVGRLA